MRKTLLRFGYCGMISFALSSGALHAAPPTAPTTHTSTKTTTETTTTAEKVTTEKVKVPATTAAGTPGASVGSTTEYWKGESDPRDFDAGFLLGVGIVDTSAAISIAGTLSRKVMEEGFIPDFNDSVSLEGSLGGVFLDPHTAFSYSAHLRWDFQRDPGWGFYALGGLGGNILDTGVAGTRFALHPRLAIGALWTMTYSFKLRAEVSHEFIGIGAVFPF